MRERVVLSSVKSQMLSSLAAITPRTLDTPATIVWVTLKVFASLRASEDVPQTGAHKLPKAEAMPPQGFIKPAMVSAFLFVFGSILSIESLPGAKAESPKKIHSGWMGASNCASGLMVAEGILAPVVLTPILGAGVFPCADLDSLSSADATARRVTRLIRIRIVVPSFPE